ncbi:hypothetical protein [Halosimplex pelagicum]|uniref:Uncharacterized protein n=1 Tax=Halosimplex pelagicum TaxID=869886 RepID=A0A7D5TI28_9EURY|nr:hypothetical protein [Halosimplex pelagicum]QLH83416.1 hypothetical protein HZS54_18045 [Halosimplex pelagicum]
MTGDLPDGPSPDEWPFPRNEFVPASQLILDEATDEEVRRAVQRVEDGDPQ